MVASATFSGRSSRTLHRPSRAAAGRRHRVHIWASRRPDRLARRPGHSRRTRPRVSTWPRCCRPAALSAAPRPVPARPRLPRRAAAPRRRHRARDVRAQASQGRFWMANCPLDRAAMRCAPRRRVSRAAARGLAVVWHGQRDDLAALAVDREDAASPTGVRRPVDLAGRRTAGESVQRRERLLICRPNSRQLAL